MLVEEGERVAAGQPLALQDDREFRFRLAAAEARASFAAGELVRIRQLVARGIAARAQIERAEREARAERAAAKATARRLDDHVVRAPAAGLVLRRDAESGVKRPLRATAEADEEGIARVAVGQAPGCAPTLSPAGAATLPQAVAA